MTQPPFRSPRLKSTQFQLNIPPTTPTTLLDPQGNLTSDKAVLKTTGVDFANGPSYSIKMDELELLEELGKGQYGTVRRVVYKPTMKIMALKQVKLELDKSKLNQILMELDVLSKSTSEYIIDFYGAFMMESSVYSCVEYMDGGSLDKLYGTGIECKVLAKIMVQIIRGLSFLKETLSIMHRDIKPTNILVNTEGQVKLCDFGVSGQLIQSMAKTNIGCQSYMAPERISSNISAYTVQSDVWSLGLTFVELAQGQYPYDSEQFDSLFALLTAIVVGQPPQLTESFPEEMKSFASACLQKDPQLRATYTQLLEHCYLQEWEGKDVKVKEWVIGAIKESRSNSSKK